MTTALRVANAPCSWGVLEFGLEGKSPGYAQVLDEMVETGYTGTELGDWGFMPTEAGDLRDALGRRGLALLGAFVPVALAQAETHAEGIQTALRVARLLSDVGGPEARLVLSDDNGTIPVRTRNAGRITPALGLTDAQWQVFAAGAERIATAVREETGLRTVFHHHCGGYVETPQEIARLMELTDPALVGLCLDTGHALFGGADPLALLEHYAQRIWHVHLKDMSPAVAAQARDQGWDYLTSVSKGVFCELGNGAVDFPALRDALPRIGYSGWLVVEQDVLPTMGSPKASAARNRSYLQSIGL